MEKIENIRQPEINREKILSLVDSIEWENGYEFSYEGINFLLFILDEKEIERDRKSKSGGVEAEIFASSVGDWDIYLYDTIPESKRKRVLFHEILEGVLKSQGFSREAHDIALKEEQKIFNGREK